MQAGHDSLKRYFATLSMTESFFVILRAAPEESIPNQLEREMKLQVGGGHDSTERYFATAQYDEKLLVILRAAPEESVSTIFNRLL